MNSPEFNAYSFSIALVLGYAVCGGVYSFALVYDREKDLRYLINFVGMKTFPYYIGNFLADYIMFMIPTLAIMGLAYFV
jgi:hypothetical protein